jgi:hypothetical protein
MVEGIAARRTVVVTPLDCRGHRRQENCCRNALEWTRNANFQGLVVALFFPRFRLVSMRWCFPSVVRIAVDQAGDCCSCTVDGWEGIYQSFSWICCHPAALLMAAVCSQSCDKTKYRGTTKTVTSGSELKFPRSSLYPCQIESSLFTYICGLFNDAVSSSGDIVSNVTEHEYWVRNITDGSCF